LNKFPFYGTYLEYFSLCILYYTVSGHIHTVYPNAHFMSFDHVDSNIICLDIL